MSTTSDSTPDAAGRSEIPMIVSVDDHVVEPAHLWQDWLPARFRDRAPHVERHGLGRSALCRRNDL